MALEYTVTVGTTATALAAAGPARELIVQNVGSVPAFTGGSTVTVATGARLDTGQQFSVFPAAASVAYAITESGTTTIRVIDSAGSAFDTVAQGLATDWSEPLGLLGVVAGQSVIPRSGLTSCIQNGVTLSNSVLWFNYFRACRSETITNVNTFCGGTAAGATPTVIRWGLYSEAANGDLTLVASTTNDTTKFATQNALVTIPLTATYALTRGQRYASAWLIVTSAAAPISMGFTEGGSQAAWSAFLGTSPRVTGRLTAQSDLPASVATANILASSPAFIPTYLT